MRIYPGCSGTTLVFRTISIVTLAPHGGLGGLEPIKRGHQWPWEQCRLCARWMGGALVASMTTEGMHVKIGPGECQSGVEGSLPERSMASIFRTFIRCKNFRVVGRGGKNEGIATVTYLEVTCLETAPNSVSSQFPPGKRWQLLPPSQGGKGRSNHLTFPLIPFDYSRPLHS